MPVLTKKNQILISTNSIPEVINLASKEIHTTSDLIKVDQMKQALIVAHYQNDFISNPDTKLKDSELIINNLTDYIYDNLSYLYSIFSFEESNFTKNIKFPLGWRDSEKGLSLPDVGTIIDSNNYKSRYIPAVSNMESIEERFQKDPSFTIRLQNYYCISNTDGMAIDNRLNKIYRFYEAYRKTSVISNIDYNNFNEYNDLFNILKRDSIKQYLNFFKTITIAISRRSFLLKTIKSLIDYYEESPSNLLKFKFLVNCSSCFEYEDQNQIDSEIEELQQKYTLNIVK